MSISWFGRTWNRFHIQILFAPMHHIHSTSRIHRERSDQFAFDVVPFLGILSRCQEMAAPCRMNRMKTICMEFHWAKSLIYFVQNTYRQRKLPNLNFTRAIFREVAGIFSPKRKYIVNFDVDVRRRLFTQILNGILRRFGERGRWCRHKHFNFAGRLLRLNASVHWTYGVARLDSCWGVPWLGGRRFCSGGGTSATCRFSCRCTV